MGFKIEKYKITAYHCKHCGAPTKPGKDLCDWCGMKIFSQRFTKIPQRLRTRLLIDAGVDFIYFDNILSIGGFSIPQETIEVTTLEDREPHYVKNLTYDPHWNITMPHTERGFELFNKLEQDKEYNIRLEMLDTDQAFEMTAKPDSLISQAVSPNEVARCEVSFLPTYFDGIKKLITPDAMTCPNCGAPVNSHYGACDFCGGWVEYEF